MAPPRRSGAAAAVAASRLALAAVAALAATAAAAAATTTTTTTTADPSGGGSSACTPALDPPGVMRDGDDFAARPLPAGAALADCVAACCADGRCLAFSFNDPQPEPACLGGTCCATGGVCCMLKQSAAGQVVNNSWPGAVRTGVLAPGPGPVPPLPRSSALGGVAWAPSVGAWTNGTGGDTWPTTSTPDGRLVGWACDSTPPGVKGFSPMALYALSGDPLADPPGGGLQPNLLAAAPIDYQALCAALGPTGAAPAINVKPGGLTALPDGSLLSGVSCMNYGDDAPFNRQHNLAGFWAASRDGGRTWANATPVGAWGGRFAAPVPVSCAPPGVAGDPATCGGEPGRMYVFFWGAGDGAAYWDANDGAYLASVPVGAWADVPGSYRFFAGLGGPDGATPLWADGDPSQAQPVLGYGRMLGENAVAYHPSLGGRYVAANFGLLDAAGRPRPWHTQPYMSPHRTQLTLLEAPQPWGPWRVWYTADDTPGQPGAPGLYTPTLPPALARRAPGDATTAQLVMLFSCLGGPPTCRYTLNWQALNVTLLPQEEPGGSEGQHAAAAVLT